jgi:hypothetical protein
MPTPLLKRIVARPIGFDGAYHRFTTLQNGDDCVLCCCFTRQLSPDKLPMRPMAWLAV